MKTRVVCKSTVCSLNVCSIQTTVFTCSSSFIAPRTLIHYVVLYYAPYFSLSLALPSHRHMFHFVSHHLLLRFCVSFIRVRLLVVVRRWRWVGFFLLCSPILLSCKLFFVVVLFEFRFEIQCSNETERALSAQRIIIIIFIQCANQYS